MKKDKPSARTYWFTGIALLVLLGLTIGAAYLDLGSLNTAVAMSISLAKGALIILFFMHVRYSRAILWLFVGAGFFWLGIMLVLAMSDYLTRGWQ
jgi:cytochrome c oxidase subunit 4